MKQALRIDWRLCYLQAVMLALAQIGLSAVDFIRIAWGMGVTQQLLPGLAISLGNWFATGLALAVGAQWTHAAARHRGMRGVVVLLLTTVVATQVAGFLLRSWAQLSVPAVRSTVAPGVYLFWRGAVITTLFFGYCLAVQRSRQRRDQLARAEFERTGTEVRLREARARALEHCVDPMLLERTIAALRATYARNRGEGESLLNALVDFLRLAMPAVRAGTTLDADRAALQAWQRLHAQLEDQPPTPTATGEPR